MKFVISASTANRVNDEAFAQLRPVLDALCLPHDKVDEIKEKMTCMEPVTHLENVSLELINGEWVLEVNDESMFITIRMIGKLARLFAPVVMAFKMLGFELKRDCDELEKFFTKEK